MKSEVAVICYTLHILQVASSQQPTSTCRVRLAASRIADRQHRAGWRVIISGQYNSQYIHVNKTQKTKNKQQTAHKTRHTPEANIHHKQTKRSPWNAEHRTPAHDILQEPKHRCLKRLIKTCPLCQSFTPSSAATMVKNLRYESAEMSSHQVSALKGKFASENMHRSMGDAIRTFGKRTVERGLCPWSWRPLNLA